MKNITIAVDEIVLCKARQYAGEHGNTLEALLAEHLALLADRAGRRLAVREQIYVDHQPSAEVIEALRAEGLGAERKAR